MAEHRTAADLRHAVLGYFNLDGENVYLEFCAASSDHDEFWARVSRLWVVHGVNEGTCADVDRATVLDDGEFDRFMSEAATLVDGLTEYQRRVQHVGLV